MTAPRLPDSFTVAAGKLRKGVGRVLDSLKPQRRAGRQQSSRFSVERLRKAIPNPGSLAEIAARIGYGARGFVYLSIGLLAFLAALDVGGRAIGSQGVGPWLAQQPFGRLWLVLLGLGLWAFVGWRVLQAVFDADREGSKFPALGLRAGQAVSALFYGLLAAGVFELLDEVKGTMNVSDIAENQEKAAWLLSLPFGDLILMGIGVVILCVGAGNVIKGARSDFGETLDCPERWRRRLSLLARAGYVARGLAYLPLAALIGLAGWHARPSEVTGLGGSLNVLEAQPGGSWMLGVGAVGLMAFGAFAFVEARFRRIHAPRDLSPLG